MDRAPRNIGHLDAMEREQELRDRLAASEERERTLREALEVARTDMAGARAALERFQGVAAARQRLGVSIGKIATALSLTP